MENVGDLTGIFPEKENLMAKQRISYVPFE